MMRFIQGGSLTGRAQTLNPASPRHFISTEYFVPETGEHAEIARFRCVVMARMEKFEMAHKQVLAIRMVDDFMNGGKGDVAQ